ncbi:MAG TPA: DoxX family protein [Paucimonas sp.]|nr:DoxX family protein [Paucimonas sp.]
MESHQNLRNAAALAGRILLGLIFVVSGFGKIGNFDGTAGYMASHGLPFVPLLLALTIAVEFGGGLLLMIGWKARWVALVFVLFLIPVTAVFHNPAAADPAQAQQQMIQLMKNLAIMGGMLQVVAFGAGAWSLDGRRQS